MSFNGYNGKILRVDLTTGQTSAGPERPESQTEIDFRAEQDEGFETGAGDI